MCDLGHTNKTLEWSCSLSEDTVRSGEDTLCMTADSSMKPNQAVTTETQACKTTTANSLHRTDQTELYLIIITTELLNVSFKRQNIINTLHQEIKAVVQLQLCVFVHLRRVFRFVHKHTAAQHGVRIAKDLITAPESVTQSPQSGVFSW